MQTAGTPRNKRLRPSIKLVVVIFSHLSTFIDSWHRLGHAFRTPPLTLMSWELSGSSIHTLFKLTQYTMPSHEPFGLLSLIATHLRVVIAAPRLLTTVLQQAARVDHDHNASPLLPRFTTCLIAPQNLTASLPAIAWSSRDPSSSEQLEIWSVWIPKFGG